MFQYPNQQQVLAKNTHLAKMLENVGKKIRFFTYSKKGLIASEKVGTIESVSYSDYIVRSGRTKFFVPSNDYISIY